VNQQIQTYLLTYLLTYFPAAVVETRKKEWRSKFIRAVMNAAKKGLTSFDKHISPMLLTMMYDLRKRYPISQTPQLKELEKSMIMSPILNSSLEVLTTNMAMISYHRGMV